MRRRRLDPPIAQIAVEIRPLGHASAVDEVQCDYGTPEAEVLYNPTVEELQRKAARGQFPPGSMGPKIEAVLAFLDGNPDGEVLITSPESFGEALAGKRGTWIR